MFEKLLNQAHVEFDLCADGPVLISSGKSNKTDPTLPDNTFITGYDGKNHTENYLVPGSTLKGVIRHYMEEQLMFSGDSTKKLFGYIESSLQKSKVQKSKVKFSDAFAVPGTVVTAVRHSTAINPYLQTAKRGTLNNMEVVEQGVFKASFIVKNYTPVEMEKLLEAVFDINTGAVRFGGKRSRGFGQMRVENFRMTSFDGYNENFEKKNEKSFTDIEAAVKYFREVK